MAEIEFEIVNLELALDPAVMWRQLNDYSPEKRLATLTLVVALVEATKANAEQMLTLSEDLNLCRKMLASAVHELGGKFSVPWQDTHGEKFVIHLEHNEATDCIDLLAVKAPEAD